MSSNFSQLTKDFLQDLVYVNIAQDNDDLVGVIFLFFFSSLSLSGVNNIVVKSRLA
jgi:hypothetical protein